MKKEKNIPHIVTAKVIKKKSPSFPSSAQGPIYNNLTVLVLSDMENAIDFFTNYVPTESSDLMDWQQLRLESPIAPDETGKIHVSDLLFSVPYNCSQEQAVFMILLEHKSSQEPSLPIQLTKYVVLKLDDMWNTGYPRIDGRIPCPVVVVLYHGKKKWRKIPVMSDVTYVPKGFQKCIPNSRHIFLDMRSEKIDQLKGGPVIRVFLELLIRSQDGTLEEYCSKILSPMAELEHDLRIQNLVKGFVHFIVNYHARKKHELSQQDVMNIITPIYKKESDTMIKTIFDKEREIGWEIGCEEGRAKGREEGREIGHEEVWNVAILALLKRRFHLVSKNIERKVKKLINSSEMYERVLDEALTANSINEFADSLPSPAKRNRMS